MVGERGRGDRTLRKLMMTDRPARYRTFGRDDEDIRVTVVSHITNKTRFRSIVTLDVIRPRPYRRIIRRVIIIIIIRRRDLGRTPLSPFSA